MGRHVQTMGKFWQLDGCRRLNSYDVLLIWIHNSHAAAAATARRNSTGWAAEDKSGQFRLYNGITAQPNMEDGFHKQRTLSRVATRVNHQQPNDRHKLLVKTKYAHPWNKPTTKYVRGIADHDVSWMVSELHCYLPIIQCMEKGLTRSNTTTLHSWLHYMHVLGSSFPQVATWEKHTLNVLISSVIDRVGYVNMSLWFHYIPQEILLFASNIHLVCNI